MNASCVANAHFARNGQSCLLLYHLKCYKICYQFFDLQSTRINITFLNKKIKISLVMIISEKIWLQVMTYDRVENHITIHLRLNDKITGLWFHCIANWLICNIIIKERTNCYGRKESTTTTGMSHSTFPFHQRIHFLYRITE